MRVLVCGGRDFGDWDFLAQTLDGLHAKHRFTLVIQGGARGADCGAWQWAQTRDIPSRTYAAKWKLHGKAAGPIRNQRMLEDGQPELVVAFPGGIGTADMVAKARAAGIEIIEARRMTDARG